MVTMKGYPVVTKNFQTNIENVYAIGDLVGSAVLKLAIRDSQHLISHINKAYSDNPDLQIGIIGGGIAGIACGYYCQQYGLSYTIYEKTTLLNTVKNFAEEKRIFMEPQEIEIEFPIKFEDCSKSVLLEQFEGLIETHKIPSHVVFDEILSFKQKQNKQFRMKSKTNEYTCDLIILSMGVQGDPVLLSPESTTPRIYYDANQIESVLGRKSSRRLLILGGGDTALENAIRFSPTYNTTLAYRGESFYRPQKKNIEVITNLEESGTLNVLKGRNLIKTSDSEAILHSRKTEDITIPYDAILVNFGNEPPKKWLKRSKVEIDSTWRKSRLYVTLPIMFVLMTALVFKYAYVFGLPMSYSFEPYWTIAYTLFVDIFGIRILFKYKTKFIRMRTLMTMFSQTVFLCIIPFLLGGGLGPWGLIHTWPLNMYVLIYYPSTFYLIYTLVYAFVVIPILTIFFGKSFYCSTLCGCGALAETVGDLSRRYSPQGKKAEKFNPVIYLVLAWAILITILWAIEKITGIYLGTGPLFNVYSIVIDIFLSAFIGLGLYSIWGGRLWCRYFCPLAAWMNLWGKLSRYRIEADAERCIKCEKCNEYCDMGIDVMKFASQGIPVTNKNSFCVGCGWCAEVCPTNVLSYHFRLKRKTKKRDLT